MKKIISNTLNIALGLTVLLIAVAMGYFIVSSSGFRNFLNSGFITALAGAVAGSGVILFIEKMRREDELLKDINICIAVLHNLINTMISIKCQNILPLRKNYFENLAAVEAAAKGNIPANAPIYLRCEFRQFTEPKVEIDIPIEKLKSLVSHVPLVAAAIFQTKQYLAYFYHTHQRLMEMTSMLETMDKEKVAQFCYLFKKDGHSNNTTYRDTINALALHTDDVLWFADHSIQLLTNAGKLAFGKERGSILVWKH